MGKRSRQWRPSAEAAPRTGAEGGVRRCAGVDCRVLRGFGPAPPGGWRSTPFLEKRGHQDGDSSAHSRAPPCPLHAPAPHPPGDPVAAWRAPRAASGHVGVPSLSLRETSAWRSMWASRRTGTPRLSGHRSLEAELLAQGGMRVSGLDRPWLSGRAPTLPSSPHPDPGLPTRPQRQEDEPLQFLTTSPGRLC